MKNFKYKYIDKSGKQSTAYISCEDAFELKNRLKAEGKVLLHYKEVKSKPKQRLKRKKLIKSDELSNFCRQMAIIVSSGVSMISSLEGLIEQANSKIIKDELTRLYNGMQMGRNISDVMKDENSSFPELLASMVALGENSGTLDSIFRSMADYYMRDNLLKKKVKSAMIYPIILLVMATGIIIGFLKFLLPNLIEIVESTGTELPAITKFVIGLSNAINNNFFLILVIIGLIIFGIKSFINTEKGRLIKDSILLKIPIVKRVIKNIINTRILQGLNMFISSGFPLLKGLELLLNSTNNAVAEISIKQAIKGVQQGESMTENLKKGDFFDKLFIQMLSVGEQTGTLQTITKEMLTHYEKEAEISINKATSLIEPIIMLVIGGLVGFLVLSVALPMFTIYNNLG